MIRVTFSDKKLEKILAQAKSENRTVLGIIYSDHIGVYFPLGEFLNPRRIYCTAKFISKLLELDKELIGEESKDIYMQYSPSVFSLKNLTIEKNEMLVIV